MSHATGGLPQSHCTVIRPRAPESSAPLAPELLLSGDMTQPAEAIEPPVVALRPRWSKGLPFLARAPEISQRQWAVLGLVSLASLFDQYDRSLMALALPQIQAGLGISEGQVGVLASIVRMGSLPALFIALSADRIGRRRALLGTVLAYTALTGASALAPDPRTFIALQFLSRVFGTAEMLLAVVVISEEFGAHARGWGVGAFFAIQSCGAGLAALLLPLAASFPNGWRGLYLVGLGPLLLLAWLRRSLPETPRFEARQRALGSQLAESSFFVPLLSLVRAYPGRFAAVALQLFCMGVGYSAADFLGPKYLLQGRGWTPGQMSTLYLIGGLMAIFGAPVLGRLGDRLGRRPVAIGASLALVGCVLAFYNASGPWLVPLWIAGIFSVTGHEAVLSAYGAELFPTSHRSTAAGARLIVGTLAGSLGLLLESALYSITGSHWHAVSILMFVALGSPIVIAFAFPETAGRSLEEISPERDALHVGDSHESAHAPR
ncbi:MAG: MFS transporter [Myxococcota bacterium]